MLTDLPGLLLKELDTWNYYWEVGAADGLRIERTLNAVIMSYRTLIKAWLIQSYLLFRMQCACFSNLSGRFGVLVYSFDWNNIRFQVCWHAHHPVQWLCDLQRKLVNLQNTNDRNAARLHQDTCCRIQVVSTCIHLSPSTCILYRRQNCRQSVAGYRDRSRPWHKWNSNYVAKIQSTSIPDEQLVSVDI